MSRSKQYIASLLDAVPVTELADFEQRSVFDQIKERLSNSDDIQTELKTLFRVRNFSDFALGLLWISDRVEKDPTMLESSPNEQTLILSAFRKAVGDGGDGFDAAPAPAIFEPAAEMPSGFGPEPTVEAPSAFPSEPETVSGFPSDFGASSETTAETPSAFGPELGGMADFPSAPSPEPASDFPSALSPEPAADFASPLSPEPVSDFPGLTPELEPMMAPPPPPAASSTPAPGEGSAEVQFAQLIEKFVEAMQNGSDDREPLKGEVLSACAAVLADGSGAQDDQKNFCTVLTEFVTYISDNQYMDDIRVMNLCSNVTDPVWEWARADAASRAGMMDAAYDVLREYKSLFE
jgi:hypothetical protein